MNYDEEFLEQVNNGVDVLEYASQNGIQFDRKGREYFASCPAHSDTTPSLTISEDNHHSFYCFGCQRGGGIIQWKQQYEHKKFDEAVRESAELAHMDLARMCISPMVRYLKKIRRDSINRQNKADAMRKQHEVLNESILEKYQRVPIKAWLDEGISQETLDTFDVRMDEYGHRIVYPIRTKDGDLINIKGRTTLDNYRDLKIIKYRNYYKIGELDYFEGLNVTKENVLDAKEIVLFESIKSVMKCFDWGVKNTAAVGNHGLTTGQLLLLLKLHVNVVFAYDNDVNIYKDKSLRLALNKLASQTNVYFIKDKDGLLGEKDAPADCGREVFQTLYENRIRYKPTRW